MEIDDDLKKLFDNLTEEEIEDQAEEQLGIPISKPEPIKPEEIKEIFPINEVLVIKDEKETIVSSNTAIIEESTNPIVDLGEIFDQFKLITGEILQACRADRQEAQDTAIMLRNKIDDAHSNNNDASRGYLDGLVKIIEVKAGINLTAVKMMEANAKILAATKAGMNIQVNNSAKAISKQGGTDHELTKLLDEPMLESDQY